MRMVTEKEMLEELNKNMALLEEIERRKKRPLRVLSGLVLLVIFLSLSIAAITTVFEGLYQKEMTLSSLGGNVYAKGSYIRGKQEIFNQSHQKPGGSLKLLYKAEKRERVELIKKKEYDKNVTSRQYLCMVKTSSGITGWTGSVFYRTEPHFDYYEKFKENLKKTPFISLKSLDMLKQLFNPEYKHTLVYTLHLFLRADQRYFWILFVSILSILFTISFLMVRNIKRSSGKLFNPSLVITRTGIIIGILSGFIAVIFKQNATLYLASGLEVFKYPSWTSFISSPVVLWLTLYVSIIGIVALIIAARPFDLINTLVFPSLYLLSLILGTMISAALITILGILLSAVAGWVAGSIEFIILVLFIIGLFSPAGSSLQSRMTNATSGVGKDDSEARIKKFYEEKQRKLNSGRYREGLFGIVEKKDGE
ncbi:MAG: hypothetical protein GX640_12730 [Fibrobacter sp.]|nr:hypothetical protein [Fibrobacter sp.]